jgi:type I restriction enzyme, S subunit
LKRIQAEKEKLVEEGKIGKEKPLPPIKEEEKPFELPKGWEWVRLGDICTIKGGKRIPKGDPILDIPTDHIYIRVTDMKDGTISDQNLKYISDEVFEKIKRYIIGKDDLYITIAGTIGNVGEIPEKFNGMNLTENAAKITPYVMDKKYLKFALMSDLVQRQFQEKFNQMAQPKLALIRISSTIFPLPPLNEQKLIVVNVEKLMSICDKLNAKLQRAEVEHGWWVEAMLVG